MSNENAFTGSLSPPLILLCAWRASSPHPLTPTACISFVLSVGPDTWVAGDGPLPPGTPLGPQPGLATGERRAGQRRGLGQVLKCCSWSSIAISAKHSCLLHSHQQPALLGLLLRDQPVVYKILSGVDFHNL